MPDNSSARHQLPYLVVAQAQKEITHNEALARIDSLLHPVVVDWVASPPAPSIAQVGKCWLIDFGSTGVWQGKANQIALWVGGSWRYLVPVESMRLRNASTGSDLMWNGTHWVVAPSIPDPISGTVIDQEARAAIVALLSHFRTIGMLSA